MDANEKKARELLAKAYRQSDYPPMVHESHNLMHGRLDRREGAALHAIIAALTPPEGYVLMPVKLPEPMLDVLWSAEGDMRDADMQDLWSALIAARPEVPTNG